MKAIQKKASEQWHYENMKKKKITGKNKMNRRVKKERKNNHGQKKTFQFLLKTGVTYTKKGSQHRCSQNCPGCLLGGPNTCTHSLHTH